MLVVRCKDCSKEVSSHLSQSRSCGCPNMTTVKGDAISAVDLSRVVVISSDRETNKTDGLTSQDLQWQEERRKRKVRKLDFEIR
tara:strand:+ start:363 stop:614 length:252 start_codon:yes stop_codon:yes gene_type:complete